MKKQLRKWLGIEEDTTQLNTKVQGFYTDLVDQLEYQRDEITRLKSYIDDIQRELEDKVASWDVEDIVRDIAYYDIDDIKSDLEDIMDYDVVSDTVFDLVMQEIENRDTLKELISAEVENFTSTTEAQGYPVDITNIVEDVVEELINKLRA